MLKNAPFCLILYLAIVFIGTGCVGYYEWHGEVPMPTSLSKDKQQEIANCIVAEINTPDLINKLVGMFPDVPKEWIQGVKIGAVDTTQVMDYYGEGIEIWISMPSSKEAYSSPSPVVEYLESIIKKQISVCSVKLK